MAERMPAEVFHPGEFLRDELAERGWSQIEFAEILGRPARLVNEIIAGKRGITPETAKELGAALGTTAQLWMNLDAAYQLWRAAPPAHQIAHKARLRSFYPVREMVRRKWIEASEDPEVLEGRLLRFFEIKSLDERPRLVYATKQTGYAKTLLPVQSAWLYRVKHIAEAMQVGVYSQKALRNALRQLEALREAPEEIRHVPRLLGECGVRLVIIEPLASSKIDGVCLWLSRSAPVIGMSLRFDRIDNFWFVLRHEVEHVLNRGGEDSAIVDSELHPPDGSLDADLPEEERMANAVATEFCVPVGEMNDFMARVGPLHSRRRVVAFASSVHVHPGLVVGQLQRRLRRYDLFRSMLVPIREIITPAAMTDGYGHICPVSA